MDNEGCLRMSCGIAGLLIVAKGVQISFTIYVVRDHLLKVKRAKDVPSSNIRSAR